VTRTLSRKRPWLAALLAVLATGLGHLYLRRWRRAAGWLAALLAASYVFVDPAAMDAVATGGPVDLVALAPVVFVGSLSALDAYLLAHAQNNLASVAVTPDGELAECPNCRKEVDPDLDFCHWCTTELPAVESASSAAEPQRDDS
jgi:hypothetical protein